MQDHGPRPSLPALTSGKSVLARGPQGGGSDERDLERDGWWRVLSAAIAMVKHAYALIQENEQMISQNQRRIAELEKLVMVDELTGLFNRRGFFEMFARELDRASRGHSHGGLLIVIDLDNFKTINDTYGHMAGDAALRLVGRTLKDNSRAMDVCARLGGDEFVLLLANADKDKALVRAQNLIKQLNHLSLVWYGAEIPVRASLGLKEYGAGDTAEGIFGAADEKLYAQKQSNKALYERSHASSF